MRDRAAELRRYENMYRVLSGRYVYHPGYWYCVCMRYLCEWHIRYGIG